MMRGFSVRSRISTRDVRDTPGPSQAMDMPTVITILASARDADERSRFKLTLLDLRLSDCKMKVGFIKGTVYPRAMASQPSLE